jgi:hypothetical protein
VETRICGHFSTFATARRDRSSLDGSDMEACDANARPVQWPTVVYPRSDLLLERAGG